MSEREPVTNLHEPSDVCYDREMFDYLIQRENDEMFRTSVRRLTFPDGVVREVEAYRLVWTWFDRSIAYEFGLEEDEILDLTVKCAEQEELELGPALGRVLDYTVSEIEASGGDYTDDNIELLLAKRGLRNFYERKGR